MRVFVPAMLLWLALGIVGCVLFLAKETRYLLSATDRATEGDVRQRLGPPSSVSTDENGKPMWIYEIREFVQGGNSTYDMTGSWWCDEYRLQFDVDGILRHWAHQSRKCG